jgi:hypothetical protein
MHNLAASVATGEFNGLKSGELYEKHAVQLGIWKPSQHLPIDEGKPRRYVSRWPVAGPSE